MIAAVNSALAGLRSASARFEHSATQIVSSGLSAVNAASGSGNPVPGNPASPPPLDLASFASIETPDLTTGLVSLKEAETQYKASAKVLASLNDLQGEVLDILS